MGRRKNRHCQSKQEVINRELLKRRSPAAELKILQLISCTRSTSYALQWSRQETQ